MGVDDDVVVLVCPEGAGPDQPIFFRDRGEKCKTVVPRNVRPGQRFRVKRSECLLRKKERPRTAQAALRFTPRSQQRRKTAPGARSRSAAA